VEITLWVEEPRVEEIIRKIIDVARTGRIGDGKIMVLPVQETHTFADTLSNEETENIVSELREL
jgi:nitrogen regulatory protein PII